MHHNHNFNSTATVTLAAFKAALTQLCAVVEKRTSQPILTTVLLDFAADKLTVIATDLDMEAIIELPAACGFSASLAIDAHALKDSIAKLKSDHVELQPVGNTALCVSCPDTGMTRRLPARLATDFPRLACGPLTSRYDIEQAQFLKILSVVQPAISTEETRYYLNGIYTAQKFFNHEGEKLVFVATDGHRLHEYKIDLPTITGEPVGDMIMPRKLIKIAVAAMKRRELATGFNVSVKYHGASKMTLQMGTLRLVSKIVDGTFPDYQRIIPAAPFETTVSGDADTFAAAAQNVTAHLSDKTKCFVLSAFHSVEPDLSYVTVAARCVENGPAGQVMTGIECEGDEIGIGWNKAYFADGMGAFKGQPVAIRMHRAGDPAVIDSAEFEGFRVVLMPIRVDGAQFSPRDIERFNLNPWDILQEQIEYVAETLAVNAQSPMSRQARKAAGKQVTEAIDCLALDIGRYAARHTVKSLIALHQGDDRTFDRSEAVLRWLDAPAVSAAEFNAVLTSETVPECPEALSEGENEPAAAVSVPETASEGSEGACAGPDDADDAPADDDTDELDGTDGQDRESYSDDQDRENYSETDEASPEIENEPETGGDYDELQNVYDSERDREDSGPAGDHVGEAAEMVETAETGAPAGNDPVAELRAMVMELSETVTALQSDMAKLRSQRDDAVRAAQKAGPSVYVRDLVRKRAGKRYRGLLAELHASKEAKRLALAARDDAIDRATQAEADVKRLLARCAALENHARVSGGLDSVKPAIILPVVRSQPRRESEAA